MSAALFGHALTLNFLIGVTIVFISMHQFFAQGASSSPSCARMLGPVCLACAPGMQATIAWPFMHWHCAGHRTVQIPLLGAPRVVTCEWQLHEAESMRCRGGACTCTLIASSCARMPCRRRPEAEALAGVDREGARRGAAAVGEAAAVHALALPGAHAPSGVFWPSW